MKLPTSKEMQAVDRCAIEFFGIPGVVLMENAGLGTVRMMRDHLGSCRNTFACIFVGPGNNGGDGLVIGRHLHQLGCKPFFFFLVKPDTLTGDAAVNLAIVQKLRLPYHVIDTESRVDTVPVLFKQIESRGLPCYAIIDALFGTGLTRPVANRYRSIIELINKRDFAHGVPVVAVDCPSGMDADTGKVLGSCIRANLTATYGCPKPGHYINDSSELTGTLEVIDIGIPAEALEQVPISSELINQETIRSGTRKLRRKLSAHKGSHGHALIVAGSPGKTGAAILAAKGALRSGCGLVSMAAPWGFNAILECNLVEAMTIPLAGSDSVFTSHDTRPVLNALASRQAGVIGPGIGTHHETADFCIGVYKKCEQPLVVDADAINILAANPEEIPKAAGPRIFTPHPGELSRLLQCSVQDIQDNRLEAARQACSLFASADKGHIVILKGAGSIVATEDGRTMINTSGNPGMATGGMGDVLAGMIAAFLCQAMSPREAASAAVYIHGAAADTLYRRSGAGYTALEVADSLPTTIQTLLT